jgi:hypothetical protein
MSFFNAPIKVPNGSAVRLENTSSNVVSLFASQTAFSGGNYSFYLPGNSGSANQVLTTDGTGITSWTTVSGGGSASNVSASNITLGASAVLLSTSSGNVRINAGAGEPVLVQVADTGIATFSTSNITAEKKLIITNTDESTSNITGALQVAGGAGITSNLFVGGNLTVAQTSNLYGNVSVSGVTNIVNNTESTSVITGALTVSGGVGITSNLNVGNRLAVTGSANITGTLDVDGVTNFNNTTEATNTTSGALIVDGGVGIAKSLYVGANLSVGARLLYAVDNFTSESLTSPLAQPLWGTSANIATIKHIQPPTNVTHYFHSNTTGSYLTGQNMHIFFTRPASNSACAANIDFGTSNLYTGTGTAQYLVLTQPGQSASLIYLSGTDSIKGWRIINTGGQVY